MIVANDAYLMVGVFTNVPIYIVLPVSLVFGAGRYLYQFNSIQSKEKKRRDSIDDMLNQRN